MTKFGAIRLLTLVANGGLLASLAALLRWGPAAIPGILVFVVLGGGLTLVKCRACRGALFQRRKWWLRYWGLTLPKACPHCGAALE